MKIYLFIIILVVAVLATIALTGYIYYLLAKHYFDNQQKTQMLQMRIDEHREAVKLVTPIRLQAYERMALYLERISPDSLVLRCYQPGMSTQLLQGVMTKTIRDEWEHNLSQQVYISSEAWNRIRQAKDEDRTIQETLDLGWKLLTVLPKTELKRVKDEFIEKYYPE